MRLTLVFCGVKSCCCGEWLSDVMLLLATFLFTFEILYCCSTTADAFTGVLLAYNPVEEDTLFDCKSLLIVLDIADIRLLLVVISLTLGCSELLYPLVSNLSMVEFFFMLLTVPPWLLLSRGCRLLRERLYGNFSVGWLMGWAGDFDIDVTCYLLFWRFFFDIISFSLNCIAEVFYYVCSIDCS